MTCYQWLMKLSNSQAGENNWRKSKSCVLELTYEQVDYSQNHFSKHSWKKKQNANQQFKKQDNIIHLIIVISNLTTIKCRAHFLHNFQ
jgi:hypothetical protein